MDHRPPVQPAVLVGGRARRFGRDKLAEPFRGSMGGEILVDQPILALRAAVNGPVWTIGDCSPLVAARAEVHIRDRWPGSAPLGGILSALFRSPHDLLVLAGDLPSITNREVIQLRQSAASHPDAQAVVARTDRAQPCIAVYRHSAFELLEVRRARGELSLIDALRGLSVVYIDLPYHACRNANRPEDLAETGLPA